MDRNFNRSLQLVLKSEGGFVNLKADPGGATNLGITIATFRTYIKPNGTIEDLKNLTVEQAGVCYRRQYWDAICGAELPDGVDYATFDLAVNSGVGRAAQFLQEVVGATQDKKVGPETITLTKAKGAADVINDLCDARLAFLHRLPTWPTFGRGWSDRVKSVRAQAINMAAAGSLAPVQPAQPSVIPNNGTVVVVTQQGNEPPVVTKVDPAPSTAPTVPKTKSGWGLLGIIIAAIAAVLAKLHFGG